MDRPLPYAENILPFLDSFRKILHVPAEMATVDNMPARGTTLTAAAANPALGLDPAGCTDTELAYIFSHATAAGSGLTALYFVQSRTGNTAFTPVLTHGGSESYTWPEVIAKIQFDSDPNIPLTTSYARGGTRGVALLPRWFVQLWRRRSRNWNSTATVRHYLSSDPFPASFFELDQPDPDDVNWDLAGHSREMLALHPRLEVPVQSGSYATIVDGSLSYASSGENEWRVIPSTNMTDWEDFVLRKDAQYTDGLWHCVEVEIEPPPTEPLTPETITV